MAGGRLSVKTAVASVATPLPTISDQPPPGFASSSRTERLLAPSETIAFSAGRLGCSLDHHLAADRETDAADPPRIDVRTALQERDRRVDVPLALPAEEVGVALALALAATVEEQDAVAMPREQLRALLRGRPSGEGDRPLPRYAKGRTSLSVAVRRWS